MSIFRIFKELCTSAKLVSVIGAILLGGMVLIFAVPVVILAIYWPAVWFILGIIGLFILFGRAK